MKNYKQVLLKILKDSSLENNIISTFKLDEILSNASPDVTDNVSSNSLENNTTASSETKTGNFKSNMNEFLSYAKNEIDQEDLQKILDEASALISHHTLEKISNMSDLFPEIKMKTEIQPMIEEIQILPLDYIETYESKHFKEILNDEFQKSLILKNYQQETTSKDKFFKVESVDFLTKKLSNSINSISCMTLKKNYLLIGFVNGETKLFYYVKGLEKKLFINDEIQKLNNYKAVVCLDFCSYDMDLFAAGHQNGYIIVWEITSGKQRIVIKNEESSLINVKFLSKSGKNFSLIASYLDGTVKLHNVTKGLLFKPQCTNTELTNSNKVFFLIETFGLSPLDKSNEAISEKWKRIPELQNSIFVIGNIEIIEIFLSNPNEIKSLKVITNPTNDSIPDVCFGFGHTQYENNGFFDFTDRQKPGIDYNGENPLLVVSWDIRLSIFIIQIREDCILGLEEVGSFFLDTPIIKIGFFESSMLYAVDQSQKIKIINTSSINDPEKNKMSGYVVDPREEYKLSDEINYNISEVCTNSKNKKSVKIYYNTIISSSKILLIQCKKSFIEASQLEWNDYLKSLPKKNEWENMFCTELEIIERKVTCLRNIPFDKDNRLSKLKNKIKEGIKEYINTNIKEGNLPESSLLKIVIEVLINIGEVDYLLGDVKSLLITKNKEALNVFYNELEPFLLSDELIERTVCFKERQNYKENSVYTDNNTKNPFAQMMDDYIVNNKHFQLSKILPHYPLEYINKEDTINRCKENNFLTTLIVIHRELNEENILLPFIQIYEAFINAKEKFVFEESERKNDPKKVDFYPIIEQNNVSNEEFENSKEYLGHKLFWYINVVLNNQTFPNKDLHFDQHTMNILIPELFLWFISSKVLNTLITFDSYNYFQILLMFFSDKYFNKIQKIHQDFFDKTKQKYEQLFKLSELDSPNLLKIITYIKENCIKYPQSEIFIREDLYEIILKLSKLFDFDNNLLLDAIKSVLSFHIKLKDSMNNTFDKFKCHYKLIFKEHEYISEICNSYLIPIIDKMFNKKDKNETPKKDFTLDRNLNYLIGISENSPYKNVHIYLLTLNHQYQKALDSLIQYHFENKYIKQTDNFYAFNYIDMLLEEKTPNEISEIKNYILDRLPQLAEISIDKVSDLIDQTFNSREKEAIDIFDHSPKLQYELVEKEIDKFITKIETSGGCYQSQLNELLVKQIELLIKLNWKNLILSKIKEKPNYYCTSDECLILCKDNNVIDASIYLYSKREQFKEALFMGTREIKQLVEKINNNLQYNNTDNEMHLQSLEDYIENCVNLCKLSNERTTPIETHELFFFLFDELCTTIKSLNIPDHPNKHIEEFHSKLFDYLQEFLNQMSCFVSLDEISSKILKNFEDKKTISKITKILEKLCKNSTNFENVLRCVKEVQKKEIMNKIDGFVKLYRKGVYFKLQKCNGCNLPINESNHKEIFHSFMCGHVVHQNCALLIGNKKEKRNILSCPICVKNSIGLESYESKNSEELMGPEDDLIVEDPSVKYREEYRKLQEKRKRFNLIGKLTMYEKSLSEKMGMLHNDNA